MAAACDHRGLYDGPKCLLFLAIAVRISRPRRLNLRAFSNAFFSARLIEAMFFSADSSRHVVLGPLYALLHPSSEARNAHICIICSLASKHIRESFSLEKSFVAFSWQHRCGANATAHWSPSQWRHATAPNYEIKKNKPCAFRISILDFRIVGEQFGPRSLDGKALIGIELGNACLRSLRRSRSRGVSHLGSVTGSFGGSVICYVLCDHSLLSCSRRRLLLQSLELRFSLPCLAAAFPIHL